MVQKLWILVDHKIKIKYSRQTTNLYSNKIQSWFLISMLTKACLVRIKDSKKPPHMDGCGRKLRLTLPPALSGHFLWIGRNQAIISYWNNFPNQWIREFNPVCLNIFERRGTCNFFSFFWSSAFAIFYSTENIYYKVSIQNTTCISWLNSW